MKMIVDTIISDHLVLLKRATEFCLRLGFDTLNKVIERLVAVSPGSVMAKWNISDHQFYGWNTPTDYFRASHSDKSGSGIAARNDGACNRVRIPQVVRAVATPVEELANA